jgi:hypothetical protein
VVAGNSQKPSQRPPGPPKRLRRSEKGFRGSRQLSKAALTPPIRSRRNGSGEARGFPRKPATLKSRPNAPRGSRNGSGEARKVSAEAGTSQKPLQYPPGPPKRLKRSEKGFRGIQQLSKAASTPPQSRRNGFGEARRISAVAGTSQKPPLRPPEAADTAPGKREGFAR